MDLCRVPQDRTKLESWERSLATHSQTPLSGMVCINHFSPSDLIPATNSRPIGLKKDAVPTIFNAVASTDLASSVAEGHQNQDSDNLENDQVLCQNESCQNLRIQYNELCKERLIEKNHDDIKIEKMEKQIADLRASNHTYSERLKSCNMRLKRNTESKEKLKSIVKELQKQKLIRENAEDLLQVNLAFFVENSVFNTYELFFFTDFDHQYLLFLDCR